MPSAKPKKPKRRPAGLELRGLGHDLVLARMRTTEPTATNAELLAAIQLYTGAPLYGLGKMSPTRAIRLIRERPEGRTPEQERIRIQSNGAAVSQVHPKKKESATVWERVKAWLQ